MDVVLIPAYRPDQKLLHLLEQLHADGFGLCVVDDGSGEAFSAVFAEAERYAAVLRLPENRGKGAALKHGLSRLLELFPHCAHFITADADGQHPVETVRQVRDALSAGADMVLTLRDFRGKVPLRSRLGNDLSRWIFTLVTGRFLRDNQSGLRGFSVSQIPWLLQVKGERYDYELNVLCHAEKQKLSYVTLPIPSVYFDGDNPSHFRPIRDTLRIYRSLFLSCRGSAVSGALCGAAVLLETIFLWYRHVWWLLPCVCAGALLLSLVWNAVVFRKLPYRDGPAMLLRGGTRLAVSVLCCFAARLWFPMVPLICVFLSASLLLMPVRYTAERLRAQAGEQKEQPQNLKNEKILP